jgi:hypothetical protein
MIIYKIHIKNSKIDNFYKKLFKIYIFDLIQIKTKIRY